MGSGGIAPRVLKLSARRRRVASFTAGQGAVHGTHMKFVRTSCHKTRREESTWKTWAWMDEK